MTTKITTKKKSLLANVDKNRESFQEKFKELQADMEIGKGNMEKITRGLKGNDINQAAISELEIDESFGNSPRIRKPKKINNVSMSNVNNQTNKLAGTSTTPSLANGSDSPLVIMKEKSFMGYDSNQTDLGASAHSLTHSHNGSTLQTVLAPSGLRVSDWCFTGSLDSSPPTVKSAELYELVRWLGKGSFGDVQLVKNSVENKLYAMKTIFSEHEKEIQKSLREVFFLRTYRHPCVIDIHDAFLTIQPKILHIVMPYCEGGDMGKLISTNRKNGVSINEHLIQKWALQLALALHFLHEHQTLHRDLKPSNVMLTDGGETIKLADFGLTIALVNNVCEKATEAGTPLYTAPEMINGEKYSYPTDCWAFGVMLYEMMRLDPPFHKGDTTELVKSILSDPPPELPSYYSHELRMISKLFLSKNPNHRLGFAAMLMDPFFYSKVLSFPSTYRPKALEERIRRTHIKQLQSQVESIPHSKLSSLTPVSELVRLISIAEQEAAEQAAAAALAAQAQIDQNNDDIAANNSSFRRSDLMKKGSSISHIRTSSANSVSSHDRDKDKENNENDTLDTIVEGSEVPVPSKTQVVAEIPLTTSNVVIINTDVVEKTLDKLSQYYPELPNLSSSTNNDNKKSISNLFKSSATRTVSNSFDSNDADVTSFKSESSVSKAELTSMLDNTSSKSNSRIALALQEAQIKDSTIEKSIQSGQLVI